MWYYNEFAFCVVQNDHALNQTSFILIGNWRVDVLIIYYSSIIGGYGNKCGLNLSNQLERRLY